MRTERRDGVVDGFIGKVNEKLGPIEKNLETMKSKKEKFEANASMGEIVFKRQLEDCKKKKEIRDRLEKAMRDSGMSEYAVSEDEGLADLQASIDEGIKQVRDARIAIEKQRQDMEKRMGKNQKKADGFKKKVGDFQKMKDGRHKEVEVEGEVENLDAPSTEKKTAGLEGGAESKVEEGKEEFPVKAYIDLYDTYLREEFGNGSEPEVVDLKKFKGMTEGIKDLAEDAYITFDQFKDLVANYLRITGVKSDRLDFLLVGFYNKKIKEPEAEKTTAKESTAEGEPEPVDTLVPRPETSAAKEPAPETSSRFDTPEATTPTPEAPKVDEKPEEPIKMNMQNNGKGDLGKFSAN